MATLNVRGGLRFLNVGGSPRGHLDMPTLIYAPRFGYAYRINKWSVWRGGWGIFYVPNNINNFRQDGFSLATQMVTSLDNNLTPYRYLSDPFPAGLTQPPGSAGGLLTGVGQSLTAGAAEANGVPSFRHGMSQQFSTGLQFVLPRQISVETSYVGDISQRLTLSRNINQYPDQFLSLRNRLNAQVPNPFAGVITDPTSALSLPTITVAQLLRPYPQFTGLTQSTLPFGRSHYDSLQVNVTKRLSAGLYFGAAYTLSKYLESSSYLNANDAKPEKVISDSDHPHHLVIHGGYSLPFLRRNRLLGGWQFNWIVTYQTGAPLSFSNAERVRRSDNNPKTIIQWFDVSQFVPQEPFTLHYLSSKVADLREDGLKNWNLTQLKKIPVTERVTLDFRGEFYNAWNTTMFGTPNTTVTSSSFGRVTGTLAGGGARVIQLSARVNF